MKVLMLSQGVEIKDQPDYDISFRRAYSQGTPVDLLNIPYIGYAQKYGGEALYNEIVRINDEFRPNLIFFQFFHSANLGDPTHCVKMLRASRNRPLIFGSVGDPFDTGLWSCLGRPLPRQTVQLASCADAFFSTSMGNVADELMRRGAKNVIFLPNAFCPMHFPDWEENLEEEKSYDIVMLCSNGRFMSRRPLRTINNTWVRRRIVNQMSKSFGKGFSIFGRGWQRDLSSKIVPFKEQVNIYKKSRAVLDAPAPIIHTDYYSSDRAFFMLGSGSPLVFFRTPRFEKILREGEHVFYIDEFKDVYGVCQKALSFTAPELMDYRERIVAFVKERHLIKHRVDTILSTAEVLSKIRSGQLSCDAGLPNIRMWHFLPNIDIQSEYKFATRAWQG